MNGYQDDYYQFVLDDFFNRVGKRPGAELTAEERDELTGIILNTLLALLGCVARPQGASRDQDDPSRQAAIRLP